MASGSSSASKPSAVTVLFARGVLAILEVWPALRVAVDQSWGGPESADKRRWLAGELVQIYDDHLSNPTRNPLPDDQYIEEMLLQVMSDEFEATIEDGSGEKVARDISKLWEDVVSGVGEKEVERLEGIAKSLKGKKVPVKEEVASDDEESMDEDDLDDSSDDDEEEDSPPTLRDAGHVSSSKPEPEVDEDGFTTVKRKR